MLKKKKTADSYCGKETQMKWNKGGGGGGLGGNDFCMGGDF